MADSKKQDQCMDEINAGELQGVNNSWQPNQERYTNQILGEAAGTNFSQQIQSSLIRKDKNRLQGINNRTAVCIATGSLTSYEALKYNFSRPVNNDEAPPVQAKKAYTRNAESKTYFLVAPWDLDDSPMGQYEAGIMQNLHTYAIDANTEIQTGAFYTQLYDDESQNSAKLISKTKEGFDSFPQINSSRQVYSTRGGSLYVENTDEAGKSPTGNTMSGDPYPAKKGNLTKAVKDSKWSPVYNPCAVRAPRPGRKPKKPRFSIGKERDSFSNTKGERSDFGPRINPGNKNGGTQQFHRGQDISTRGGYPIVAVADGVIERIYMDKKNKPTGQDQPKTDGNCLVVIRHTTNPTLEKEKIEVRTTYMHLLRISNRPDETGRLQKNDEVKAGQTIAYMGGGKGWPGSGNTSGPHLHFEVGIRKRKSDGTFDYDTFTADDGKTYLKDGGPQGTGPVDPLNFIYPKLATFSREKAVLDEIKSFLPKTQADIDAEALAEKRRITENLKKGLTADGKPLRAG